MVKGSKVLVDTVRGANVITMQIYYTKWHGIFASVITSYAINNTYKQSVNVHSELISLSIFEFIEERSKEVSEIIGNLLENNNDTYDEHSNELLLLDKISIIAVSYYNENVRQIDEVIHRNKVKLHKIRNEIYVKKKKPIKKVDVSKAKYYTNTKYWNRSSDGKWSNAGSTEHPF